MRVELTESLVKQVDQVMQVPLEKLEMEDQQDQLYVVTVTNSDYCISIGYPRY